MAAALAKWLLLPSTKRSKVDSGLSLAPICCGISAGGRLPLVLGAGQGARAARQRVLVREPISTTSVSASPCVSRSNALMRGAALLCTQSTAKRLGASSRNSPFSRTACNGRNQVLTCCSGISCSRRVRIWFQSSHMLVTRRWRGLRRGRASLPALTADAIGLGLVAELQAAPRSPAAPVDLQPAAA